MFKKVVIPLDGSPLASLILDHIPYLLPTPETEFILVQVIEAWRYAFNAEGVAAPNIANYLQENAEAYLKQQLDLLRAQGYEAQAYVARGDAAHEILHIAAMTGADLIAMTTHGRSGLAHWALGSIAERVLHESTLPVLLVREASNIATAGVRHLLVPLDGSPQAEQVFTPAMNLAKDLGAELLLLRAIPTPDEGNQRLLFANKEAATTAFQKWLAEAEEYLGQLAQQFQSAGITTAYQASLGDPVQVICDAIAEKKIDMVVLSTHGRTGMSRWYYGSVANKLLRTVQCPLLMVRTMTKDVTIQT